MQIKRLKSNPVFCISVTNSCYWDTRFYRPVLPPHQLDGQLWKLAGRDAGRSRKEIACARCCGCNRSENVNRGDNDPAGVVQRGPKLRFRFRRTCGAMCIKVNRYARGRRDSYFHFSSPHTILPVLTALGMHITWVQTRVCSCKLIHFIHNTRRKIRTVTGIWNNKSWTIKARFII